MKKLWALFSTSLLFLVLGFSSPSLGSQHTTDESVQIRSLSQNLEAFFSQNAVGLETVSRVWSDSDFPVLDFLGRGWFYRLTGLLKRNTLLDSSGLQPSSILAEGWSSRGPPPILVN